VNRSVVYVLMITVVASFALAACGEQQAAMNLAPSPVYDPALTPAELATAKKAYAIFSQVAQPLMGEYAGDIESIEVSKGFERTGTTDDAYVDYRCRDYGWNKQIYIKVKIKDETKSVPDDIGAWGHTEHYYLGGPTNPGITLSKHPQLCGKADLPNGEEVFMAVEGLNFICK